MELKQPWRKRHPILFWGGILLLFALTFGGGRMSEKKMSDSGPRLAVVQVEGVILDAEDIVAFMEKVRKDSTFKGAILRINSPGGAVGPSQEMYAAVKRLAQAKPVVASMSSVAASGGYYVALGANRVIAGPSSLTASIGVKMQVPNIEALMRTIGISEITLTTGKLKDAGSTWRDMEPEEEAYFKALITDMYEEFIDTVAKERKLTPEQVRTVADGRVMTGRQALEAGLVDELGDFYAAVNKAKELAGIAAMEEIALVKGPEKKKTLLTRLIGSVLHTLREESGAAQLPVFMY
jgi:protease-4